MQANRAHLIQPIPDEKITARSSCKLVTGFSSWDCRYHTCHAVYFPLLQQYWLENQGEWNWHKGTRFGEALNPGPGNTQQDLTFAILNPTALSDRHQEIVNLDADTNSLVETSVTSTIQYEFTKYLSRTNYRVHWVHLFPNKRHR